MSTFRETIERLVGQIAEAVEKTAAGEQYISSGPQWTIKSEHIGTKGTGRVIVTSSVVAYLDRLEANLKEAGFTVVFERNRIRLLVSRP